MIDMLKLLDCFANESPYWAFYSSVMARSLVDLDKCSSVRPMGIGEVFW